MSSFAVFLMTRDVAMADHKKRTKGTRKNVNAPCGVEPIPHTEWLDFIEKKAELIMRGTVRQLSPLFDAPQYGQKLIELTRKNIQCRNLSIRAKRAMAHADNKPIVHPKTLTPKVELHYTY